MGELPLNRRGGGLRPQGRQIGPENAVLAYLLLITLAATMLVPFIWMLSASLQMDKDVFRFPFRWIPNPPRWKN